jgi:DNA-binding NarL/FixJ family response regulator
MRASSVPARYDRSPVLGGTNEGGGAHAPDLRVLVVDDHEVLRRGTRQVLETAEGIAVVGEAGDGQGALDLAEALDPDVVLLDVRLPGADGMNLARELKELNPRCRIVILSGFDDDDYVRGALNAGVSGYLLKSIPGEELISAVRAAARGTIVLDPALTARLARGPSRLSTDGTSPRLTMRERQVVRLVAEGLPNKEIARQLDVSVRTVEGHLNNVFAKLKLASRTELVRYAFAHDLSPRPSPAGVIEDEV